MTLGIALGARKLSLLLGEMDDQVTFYRALADRIRLLIIDGRVPVGTRLPSERDLAGTLGRSRSTVVAAYNLLRETGYVRSRQGSGSIAALPDCAPGVPPLDFAHAVPGAIPGLADYLRRATNDIGSVLDAPAFDMRGDERLRDRIAQMYDDRDLATLASQVLVTVGGQHALGVVARALVRPGDRILMDSPCYPHAYDAFQAVGGRIVTTPTSRDGWDLDHYVALLERFRPTVAYLMPDFQNPTGASMAPADRDVVAGTAARTGTTLVVDETTADLDIERGWAVRPFAHLASEHGVDVVTIGSLSKSVWGGLRLGWVRAQQRRIDHLVRRRPTFDLGTPRLEQLVATELVPDLPSLLPRRSEQLRTHRDHLVAELRAALPDWDVPTPLGGLSLWVSFEHAIASSLAVLARTRGLSISAGPRFTLDGSHERFVRLPYTAPLDELSRGAGVLGDVWESLVRSGRAFDLGLDSIA